MAHAAHEYKRAENPFDRRDQQMIEQLDPIIQRGFEKSKKKLEDAVYSDAAPHISSTERSDRPIPRGPIRRISRTNHLRPSRCL
jgi:hypothetical protein